MNNTIDFNTAKTIGTMSKKIDHIDDTVSGFFSFMHMVMQNELGNAEPYFAAVSPVLDLTVIRPDDAPHILPCFDEADEGIGISEDEPLGFRYNPKQIIKLMGKRYLVGPVIFHRFDDERDFASLTMSDMYTMPTFPPKPNKLNPSTKRRTRNRPPLFLYHRLILKTRCGEVLTLKTANFGSGKCSSKTLAPTLCYLSGFLLLSLEEQNVAQKQ